MRSIDIVYSYILSALICLGFTVLCTFLEQAPLVCLLYATFPFLCVSLIRLASLNNISIRNMNTKDIHLTVAKLISCMCVYLNIVPSHWVYFDNLGRGTVVLCGWTKCSAQIKLKLC